MFFQCPLAHFQDGLGCILTLPKPSQCFKMLSGVAQSIPDGSKSSIVLPSETLHVYVVIFKWRCHLFTLFWIWSHRSGPIKPNEFSCFFDATSDHFLAPFGPSWAPHEPLWASHEPFWAHFGSHFGHSGVTLGHVDARGPLLRLPDKSDRVSD